MGKPQVCRDSAAGRDAQAGGHHNLYLQEVGEQFMENVETGEQTGTPQEEGGRNDTSQQYWSSVSAIIFTVPLLQHMRRKHNVYQSAGYS